MRSLRKVLFSMNEPESRREAWVRRLAVLFLICFFVVCSFLLSKCYAFTWEGELDPNEFVKWQIIDVRMIGTLKTIVTIQNPNMSAEIQQVQMIVYINLNGSGTLLSYRYFKGGEIYEYETNADMDRYKRYEYTKKERRACMQCHSEIKEFI